jgi:hypothetical protein
MLFVPPVQSLANVIVPPMRFNITFAFTLKVLGHLWFCGDSLVAVNETIEPFTSPASVPLPAVVPHVPEREVPDCSILKNMANAIARWGGFVDPDHNPATEAGDEGAVKLLQAAANTQRPLSTTAVRTPMSVSPS